MEPIQKSSFDVFSHQLRTFSSSQWRDSSSSSLIYRRLEIDAERAQDDQRTIEASLSSEHPVLRGDGYEVLDHSTNSVNLERATDNELPLLVGHNHNKLIGKVENLRVWSGRLRGRLKFGRSQLAEEVWQDVKDGMYRSISIGYMIEEREPASIKSHQDSYRVTRWKPYEVSLVSVPADHTVGVGRALDLGLMPHGSAAAKELRKKDCLAACVDAYKDFLTGEAKRECRELCADLVADPEADEEEAEQRFNSFILERMGRQQPINHPDPEDLDLRYKGNGMKDVQNFSNYSISRAIIAAAGGMRGVDTGFEEECSQEAARVMGKRSTGIIIPHAALSTRAVTYGGTGSNLVQTEHLSDSFIEMLRKRSAVLELATVLSDLQGNVAIPKQIGSASAGWHDLDGTDTISSSDSSYGSVNLTPTSAAALTAYSHKMLMQANPSIDQLIRSDLAKVIALEIDRAAICGSGSGNEPTGILNTAGIGSVVGGTNGLAPAWDHIVELETAVAVDSADIGTLRYITNSKVRGKLKQTFVDAGSGERVWDSKTPMTPLNGYGAVVSEQVPSDLDKGTSTGICSAIIFGNFADLIIGMWGGIEILADPYGDNFAKATVSIRAIQDLDVAVRHAESFAAMVDALTN